MKIKLPEKDKTEQCIEGKNSIVLIGANGAGKTRMSIWIEENNADLNVHRISAQKSLNMPKSVSPVSLKKAEELFLYGNGDTEDKEWLKLYGKKAYRWGDAPETFLLNDFDALMVYLMSESYEKSTEYRLAHKNGNTSFDNETKLEKIKSIWDQVITHRKLIIGSGQIEVESDITGISRYNAQKMSDGERAIFYYIAEVICAKENSLIIIDEPENHLHQAILASLWNAIEKSRSDCVLLYVTHNFDFACSRINSQIVWVKSWDEKNLWEYDLLDNSEGQDDGHYDKLMLEILGSRQKVLLVEGTKDKSFDKKLYSILFPDYNVLAVNSCNSVIQTVKSYNNSILLHHNKVEGIVDRDRRTDKEINSLREEGIMVLEVAEIENLFFVTRSN